MSRGRKVSFSILEPCREVANACRKSLPLILELVERSQMPLSLPRRSQTALFSQQLAGDSKELSRICSPPQARAADCRLAQQAEPVTNTQHRSRSSSLPLRSQMLVAKVCSRSSSLSRGRKHPAPNPQQPTPSNSNLQPTSRRYSILRTLYFVISERNAC